jgi:hypothetical protein
MKYDREMDARLRMLAEMGVTRQYEDHDNEQHIDEALLRGDLEYFSRHADITDAGDPNECLLRETAIREALEGR